MIDSEITLDVWKYDDFLRRGVGKLWDDSDVDDQDALIRLGKKRWGFVRILDALLRDDTVEFVLAVELLTSSFPPPNLKTLKDFDVVGAPPGTYPPTGNSDINPFVRPKTHLPPLGLDETQRGDRIAPLDGDFNPFTNSPTNHAAPMPGTDEYEDSK